MPFFRFFRSSLFPSSLCSSALVMTLCGAGLAADDSAQEKQFLSNARQLVFEGIRSAEAYYALDAVKIRQPVRVITGRETVDA